MRKIVAVLLLLIASTSGCFASEKAVNAVLDALHTNAALANAQDYFSVFSDDAIFIGTDAGEVWTIPQFKEYAMPHFNKGTGWTYHPYARHLYFSDDGNTAWFDELLKNEKLGVTRGTGVVVKQHGAWKIAQYHLAIPIPNAIAKEVAEQIKVLNKKGSK